MSLTGAGTWGPPERPDEARRLLRRAVEAGVELIDTADSYGPGSAEELVADALHPYDGLLVATKGGLTRQGPKRWSVDCRPEALRAACERSLTRLRLDAIDLYYLHAVDPDVPFEESLGSLVDLRAAGKIRHIGISNVTVEHLDAALDVAPVVAVQNRFSLADRSSSDVVRACERHGVSFVAWAPLAKGGLTRANPHLGAVASRHGASVAQVALAWTLAYSPSVAAIPGTSSVAHLEENLGARELTLEAEDVARLGARSFEHAARRPLARRARARAGRFVDGLRSTRGRR
jgi:aryl-alcohol dehydrogenase-like predicted oxidoreductase